jgi:hypothetical protein
MHVITGLSTGGAETMLLKLLSAASGSMEHVVVSLGDEGTIGPRIAALGVPVHCLGSAAPHRQHVAGARKCNASSGALMAGERKNPVFAR